MSPLYWHPAPAPWCPQASAIDSDYRGEIKVILINLGAEPFTIARGERIAQLVLAPVTQLGWAMVDTLDETRRGTGGFGSTGQ